MEKIFDITSLVLEFKNKKIATKKQLSESNRKVLGKTERDNLTTEMIRDLKRVQHNRWRGSSASFDASKWNLMVEGYDSISEEEDMEECGVMEMQGGMTDDYMLDPEMMADELSGEPVIMTHDDDVEDDMLSPYNDHYTFTSECENCGSTNTEMISSPSMYSGHDHGIQCHDCDNLSWGGSLGEAAMREKDPPESGPPNKNKNKNSDDLEEPDVVIASDPEGDLVAGGA